MTGGATFDRPVFVIGSVRSGTTLLGSLLAEHPDLAYWEEPKHIWRHRTAYRRNDVLGAADATPAITAYIRKQFAHYVGGRPGSRLLEKTPSNCLRIPFMREIFPEALFVHVIRDGRASAASARVQWRNDFQVDNDDAPSPQRTNSSHDVSDEARSTRQKASDSVTVVRKFVTEKQRLRGGPWAVLDAPASAPALYRVLARKLSGPDKSYLWGTHFPGMAEIHKTRSLLETCALQWSHSVEAAQRDLADVPEDRLLTLRFEDLSAAPAQHLGAILSFAELPHDEAMVADLAGRVRPDKQTWRTILTDDELATLNAVIGPLLTNLGYGE